MSRHVAFFGNVVYCEMSIKVFCIIYYISKKPGESVCEKKMINMLSLKVRKACFITLET